MVHYKLTIWIGPIASPTLISFLKIALSKAGTIIPGLNMPKLEGGNFLDRSRFMTLAMSRQLFFICSSAVL